MLKQITINASLGKTIKAVSYSVDDRHLAIVFSDGTFAFLASEDVYDSLEIIDGQFKILDFGDTNVVRSGIASQTEIESARTAQVAKYVESNERERRELYERLKKEFRGE